jgi:hypothetical protein
MIRKFKFFSEFLTNTQLKQWIEPFPKRIS